LDLATRESHAATCRQVSGLVAAVAPAAAQTPPPPALTDPSLGITVTTQMRFDVINLFDNSYRIRDGRGVGGGAPPFYQRRTFLLGLTQKF
jgi:outer membrane receptor protein involved in Fe transport